MEEKGGRRKKENGGGGDEKKKKEKRRHRWRCRATMVGNGVVGSELRWEEDEGEERKEGIFFVVYLDILISIF